MILSNEKLDSIVVTIKDTEGILVTAEDKEEVIAVIADDKIIVKDGYEIKLISAED